MKSHNGNCGNSLYNHNELKENQRQMNHLNSRNHNINEQPISLARQQQQHQGQHPTDDTNSEKNWASSLFSSLQRALNPASWSTDDGTSFGQQITTKDTANRERKRRVSPVAAAANSTSNSEGSTINAQSPIDSGIQIGDSRNKSLERRHLSQRVDVANMEKYIELALILSHDVFEKRRNSSRLEIIQDAIQIVNCVDMYLRSANTRVSLIYIETWAHNDQINIHENNSKQTLLNLIEYASKKLHKVSIDAIHLIA